MHVSIGVVAFRNLHDIQTCLQALERSTHADFDVVVCENGGAAAFAALQAALPSRLPSGQPVRLICAADNPGFAAGVNRCIAAAPGAEAWWVLNPDTVPAPGALAALVERLERGGCDMVGGVLHRPDGAVQAYGGRFSSWLARAESLGNGRQLEAPIDAATIERQQNYVLGASMLVSRRFMETAGPMREDYFLYAEEIEWCLRGLKLGLRLGFAPQARVLHDQGATTGSGEAVRRRPRRVVQLDHRNALLLIRDTQPSRLPPAVVASVLLALARYGRRGAWRQVGYALAGTWDGLLDRRGKPAWFSI